MCYNFYIPFTLLRSINELCMALRTALIGGRGLDEKVSCIDAMEKTKILYGAT